MAYRSLNVTTKTGFKVTDPTKPVIIRDNRGILFYSTEDMLPRVKEFNLPIGNYLVEAGSFKPLPLPVLFTYVKLPPYERVMKDDPKKFSIVFQDNPHKCSVIWNLKTIVFDHEFKEKPLPQIDFILGHEYGHRYYTTESKCDLYAVNKMLRQGYNPSQIGNSPIESLSSRQDDRKTIVVKKIIKANKKR